jgi:hypothetical protein
MSDISMEMLISVIYILVKGLKQANMTGSVVVL